MIISYLFKAFLIAQRAKEGIQFGEYIYNRCFLFKFSIMETNLIFTFNFVLFA